MSSDSRQKGLSSGLLVLCWAGCILLFFFMDLLGILLMELLTRGDKKHSISNGWITELFGILLILFEVIYIYGAASGTMTGHASVFVLTLTLAVAIGVTWDAHRVRIAGKQVQRVERAMDEEEDLRGIANELDSSEEDLIALLKKLQKEGFFEDYLLNEEEHSFLPIEASLK
ncbi:hypothetical protein FYJ51_12925 [Erysipelotrichaceae bacterium Oil+RF-744-GAM-WT-6]|jgi:hypothetical protein|uniref:Uncharacterized protein n=1 Tax=Stecheria intestinalis TaxID=2606630 RepID=A0A7X2THQ0_9FIRM|nr:MULTISPECIES: hypothetical protein [Erysipelotrichaceae]MCI2154252.1 hypothetical protein [Solobacterium sp.]MDY3233640.1 hypothetical protein [Erysipelotrichaceae bacterium]MDY4682658.1 hypothetical protein [Lachnospiraceae bacterium]MDD5880949.1 hypothetical protein [Stecheria intestinalis]MDD6367019.1 hypothetical protein [Stecheria intestinalis]